MANRFWVGGGGTWDNSATTHWATSSGGASGASAPTSSDDVTFDANSFSAASQTCTVASGAACNNLTISGITQAGITFSLSANFAPGGSVSITGNSRKEQLLFASSTTGTARTLTIATLTTLSNTDFRDITGAGAASPFTGTAIGDCLGNSNITTTTPATQTYAGGTANWSSAAAWTSRVPLPQDDVVVNTTTAGTLTQDYPARVGNIDFTNFTRTISIGANSEFYGSVKFVSGMTISGATNSSTFRARSSVNVTWAGKTWTPTSYNGPGGTWVFQDDMGANSSETVTLSRGTIDLNGHVMSCKNLNAGGSNTRGITFGGGTLQLRGTGTLTVLDAAGSSNFTLSGSGTVDILATDSGVTKTFAGGGLTWPTLKHATTGSAGLTITGSNTFSKLDLECTTARTITFPANGTQTIYGLTIYGASGQNLSLVSSSGGTAATINRGVDSRNSFLTTTDITFGSAATQGTATASNSAGDPKVEPTGVQAAATAACTAGAPTVSPGAAQASASATATGGTPNVAVTGVQGAATASADGGAVGSAVAGVQATATATCTAGSLMYTGTVTGVQASASASCTAGTPTIAMIGTQASATASCTAGGLISTVTGVQATATASCTAGSAFIGTFVVGSQATATATGQVGSPKITMTGVQAGASATGITGGVPKVGVTGVRASATAAGNAGSIVYSSTVTGAQAIATATGQTGVARIRMIFLSESDSNSLFLTPSTERSLFLTPSDERELELTPTEGLG